MSNKAIKETIQKISYQFLLEATNSPQLLEDMAAMEKYMAESYSGRTFVELLQNADDAASNKVIIMYLNGDIIFANNGRPFDENDVVAICRSGSSSKQRGNTIGYRGIGFKSTTCLTEDIIIYSSDCYFTFSKKRCAEELNTSENRVPTIRVPFVIESTEISKENLNAIEKLKNEGFTTIFIMKNADYHRTYDEIFQFGPDYFIFLCHVNKYECSFPKIERLIQITRHCGDDEIIEFTGQENERWLIKRSSKGEIKVDVAFKLNQNNEIIPCEEDEAVFHCFLPTVDPTGCLFKINSDFSTDPSRKHIDLDANSEINLKMSAEFIASIIKSTVSNSNVGTMSPIFGLLNSKRGFGKLSLKIKSILTDILKNDAWLQLNNGSLIKPEDYLVLPDWLEESNKKEIRNKATRISSFSLPEVVYERVPQIDELLLKLSAKPMDTQYFIDIIQEFEFVFNVSQACLSVLWANIIKQIRLNLLVQNQKPDLSECFVTLNDGIIMLENIDSNTLINYGFLKCLEEQSSQADIEWFCSNYNQDKNVWITKKDKVRKNDTFNMGSHTNIKSGISRWRTAEQQCVEIEINMGNIAEDVSKQNLGYDVRSITKTGEQKYIEVKSIKRIGDSFTLTNNEYSAAHQFGDNYYICLIYQQDDSAGILYIQNPLVNLKMEKRVKVWEWFCDEYSGKQMIVKYQ